MEGEVWVVYPAEPHPHPNLGFLLFRHRVTGTFYRVVKLRLDGYVDLR